MGVPQVRGFYWYKFHVTTPTDSATDPDDYTAVTNRTVTLDANTMSRTVPVPIINDNRLEGNESFTANLREQVDNPRVVVDPENTEVIILDNDGGCGSHASTV